MPQNGENAEATDPTHRDEALRLARKALSDAAKQLGIAASHAGDLDETRADLELLREEACDVYARVAALSLRFAPEVDDIDDSRRAVP